MQGRMEYEVRDRLAAYLAGDATLGDFQEWFVLSTWDLEETGNQTACELAHEIHLKLAEFSNGHWTEEELRRELRPLVSNYAVSISFGAQSPSTHVFLSGSSTYLQRIAGRELEVAFSS